MRVLSSGSSSRAASASRSVGVSSGDSVPSANVAQSRMLGSGSRGQLDERLEHALVVAAGQRVGRALAHPRVVVAAQPQQRLGPVVRAEVAERARDRGEHLRVVLALRVRLERRGALGRERALRDAELAEHVGADRAGARVVAAEQLPRRRRAPPGRRATPAPPCTAPTPRPSATRGSRPRRAPRASARAAAGRARSPSARDRGGRAASRRPRIGRPPGGWISVSSSAPPLQSSSSRSPSARRRPPAGASVSPSTAAAITPRKRAVGQRQPRADVRPQRPHHALDLLGRPRRVERAVARLDLVRVGHARLVLLDERRPLVERAHERLAADAPSAAPRASRSRRRAGSARARPGTPARSRAPPSAA